MDKIYESQADMRIALDENKSNSIDKFYGAYAKVALHVDQMRQLDEAKRDLSQKEKAIKSGTAPAMTPDHRRNLLQDISNKKKIVEDYSKNPQKWMNYFNNELNSKTHDMQGTLSFMLKNKMTDIASFVSSQDMSLFMNLHSTFGRGNINRQPSYSFEAAGNFYRSQAGHSFFESLIGSVTGKGNAAFSSIQNATLNFQHMNGYVFSNAYTMNQGLENIRNKGVVAVMDFETLGGEDEFGNRRLDQITEKSYQIWRKSKNGKWVQDKKASINFLQPSSQAQLNKYREVINKYKNGGGAKTPLTNEERVIFSRLKMQGASTYEAVDEEHGLFRYSHFASAEEVPGFDQDAVAFAEKGLAMQTEISNKIHHSKRINGMYGYEKAYLDMLSYIQNNDITLASYNGEDFDSTMANWEFAEEKNWSGAAWQRIQNEFHGVYRPNYHTDVLLLERMNGRNQGRLTPDQVDILKKYGLTSKQLEALNRLRDPEFYEKQGAHLADIDVSATAELLLNTGRYGIMRGGTRAKESILTDSFKEKAATAPLKIGLAEQPRLFFATHAIDDKFSHLMHFTYEPIQGEYQTSDSFGITKSGEVKPELFGAPGVQKNVAYSVTGVRKLTPTEATKAGLSKMNQAFSSNELYSITFTPQGDTEFNMKAFTPVTYVGTKENIENVLNTNFYSIAHGETVNGRNHWVADMDTETLHAMQLSKVENGQLHHIQRNDLTSGKKTEAELRAGRDMLSKQEIVSTALHESGLRMMDEAAGRARRELNIKKDSNLINFIDKVDEYADQKMEEYKQTHPTPDQEIDAIEAKHRQKMDDIHGNIKKLKEESQYLEDKIKGYSSFIKGDKAIHKRGSQGYKDIQDEISSMRKQLHDNAHEISRQSSLLNDEKNKLSNLPHLRLKKTIDFTFNKPEEFRREFREKVMQRSFELADKIRKGTAVKEDYENTWQKFFGFTPKNADPNAPDYKVYRSTVDAAVASEHYVRLNRGAMETAIKKAREMSSDPSVQKVYYRQIMEEIMGEAKAIGGKEAIGQHIQPVRDYDLKKYELNLKGFKNINNDAILRINLDSSGYDLTGGLMKKLHPKEDLSRYSEEDKLSVLADLQTHLYSRYNSQADQVNELELNEFKRIHVGKWMDGDKEHLGDTVGSAAEKILADLRDFKQRNPALGVVNDTLHYTVISDDILGYRGVDPTHINFGLTNKQLDGAVQRAVDSMPSIEYLTSTSKRNLTQKELKEAIATDRAGISSRVAQMVDSVVFTPVTAEQLKKDTGYGDEEIKGLMDMQEIRRKDAINQYTNLFDAVQKAGGGWGYDKSSGKIVIIDRDGAKMAIDPIYHGVYHHGMFANEVDGNYYVNPVGYVRTGWGRNHNVQIGSRILQADDSVSWAYKKIKQAGKDGKSFLPIIEDYISGMRKVLRETTSDSKNDILDVRNSGLFNMAGAVEIMPQLYKNGEGYFKKFSQPVYQTDEHGEVILDKYNKPKLELDSTKNQEVAMNNTMYKWLHSFYNEDGEFIEKDVDLKNLGSDVVTAINMNRNYIIDQITKFQQANGNHELYFSQSFLDLLSGNTRKTQSLYHTILGKSGNSGYGEQQGPLSRGEHEQFARNFKFDIDRLNKEIMTEHDHMEGIHVGSIVNTDVRHQINQDDLGTGHKVDTTIRAREMSVETSTFHHMVSDAINNGYFMDEFGDKDVAARVASQLMLADTHEGTSQISIDLADLAMTGSSFQQTINLSKIYVQDKNTLADLDEKEQKRLIKHIEQMKETVGVPLTQDKNGKFSFHYNQGRFVQEGDDLVLTKMMDAGQMEQAKYTGFARYGVFAPGNSLVSEKEVNRILSLDENQKKLQNAKTVEDRMIVYSKILTDNGLTDGIYVKDAAMSANIKVSNMTAEKTMARVLGSPLGYLDKEVSATVDELFGKTSYDYDKSGRITRRYGSEYVKSNLLNREIFDSLKNWGKPGFKSEENDFLAIVNGFRHKKDQITAAEMEAIIKSHFKDVNEFRRHIIDERRAVTDALTYMARRQGTVKDGQRLHRITFLSEELAKHNNMNVLLQQAADIYFDKHLRGYVTRDGSGKITNYGPHGLTLRKRLSEGFIKALENADDRQEGEKSLKEMLGLSVNKKNGMINASVNADINNGRILAALENMGISDKALAASYSDKEGHFLTAKQYEALSDEQKKKYSMSAQVYTSEFGQDQNLDRARVHSIYDASGKRAHLTHRNFEIMAGHTFDEDTLKTIKHNLKNALADGVDADRMYEAYFSRKGKNAVHDGEIVMGQMYDHLWQGFYAVPEEAAIAERDKNGVMQLSRSKGAVEARAHLREEGIDSEFMAAAVDVAAKHKTNAVSYRYIHNMFLARSYSVAQAFNSHQKKEFSLDFMQKKAGFQVININDLVTSHAGNVEGIMNSMYNKNILLDLHDSRRSKQIYENEADRYVAMPFVLSRKMAENDDFIQAEYQKSFKRFLHKYNDLYDQQKDAKLTAKESSDKMDQLRGELGTFLQSISKETSGKKRIVATTAHAMLGDSAILTTNEHRLIGKEIDEFSKGLTFSGEGFSINLVKQAAKNASLDEAAGKGAKAAAVDISYAIGGANLLHRFYNQNYFEKLGFSGDQLKEVQKAVFGDLAKNGTLASHSRDPQGYLTSTNAAALYFNEGLEGDNLLASAALQAAKKNDNDSDKTTIGVLKGKADITIGNGPTKTVDVDMSTYRVLNNMQGVNIKLHEETEKLFHDATRSIIYEATTINPFFTDKGEARTAEQAFGRLSSSSSHFEWYADGGFGYDHGKMGKESRKWLSENGFKADDIKKLRQFDYAPGRGEYSQEERERLSSAFEETRSRFLGSMSEKDASKYMQTHSAGEMRRDMAKFVYKDVNGDVEQYGEQMKAFRYATERERNVSKIASDARKNGAGLMNYNIFGFYQIARDSGAYKGTQLRDMLQLYTSLQEAYLSPKNEKGIGDISLIQRLSEHANHIYNAAQSGSGPNSEYVQKAKQEMMEFLQGSIGVTRRGKELSKLSIINGVNDEKTVNDAIALATRGMTDQSEIDAATKKVKDDIQTKRINIAFETFSDFATKVNLGMTDRSAYRVGQSNNGVASDQLMKRLDGSTNKLQETLENIDEISQKTLGASPMLEMEAPSPKRNSETYNNPLDDLSSVLSRNEEHNSTDAASLARDIADKGAFKVADAAKSIIHAAGGLKHSIVGMAGGLLLAGYGSSPSSSATQQAQDGAAATQQQPQPQMMQLSDSNLNVKRSGSQSYVININANSSRGQAHAQQAISAAVSSGAVPMNGTINVQNNVDYRDKLNSLQLGQMMQSVLAS